MSIFQPWQMYLACSACIYSAWKMVVHATDEIASSEGAGFCATGLIGESVLALACIRHSHVIDMLFAMMMTMLLSAGTA